MPRLCDVCGQPATVIRPATRKRGKFSGYEEVVYCDEDAARFLGWGDTYHRLDEEDTT
jgi:hypothetical protein